MIDCFLSICLFISLANTPYKYKKNITIATTKTTTTISAMKKKVQQLSFSSWQTNTNKHIHRDTVVYKFLYELQIQCATKVFHVHFFIIQIYD